MTLEEALARVDELREQSQSRDSDLFDDAQRVLRMLPAAAMEKLKSEWIRPRRDKQDGIELFWSLSFNLFNPGNKITTIRTLGGGQFSIEMKTSSPEKFDESKWQIDKDGNTLTRHLSLNLPGADELIAAVFLWQTGLKQ